MADPISVAAVAMIAPYLAKAGEAAASKAGEAVWQAAESLYHKIHAKFSHEHDIYAEQTLQRLEDQPTNEERQAALADVLTDKLQADPSFAQELQQAVQGAAQTQGTDQFLTSVHDNAQVDKIINIGQLGYGQF